MAKRERYTERARPHRREVGAGGPIAASDGLRNPVVLIALGGFAVALVLAVAVFIGRSMANGPTDQAAAAPTPQTQPTTASAPTLASSDSGAAATTAAPAASDKEQPVSKKQYAAPEDQGLDAANHAYFATIATPKGTIKAQLWPDLAPQTVNSFVFLARETFFDGLTFHRVVPNFVIQGGDPQGNGQGGPGYSVPAEFTDVPHVPGILSMARTSDPNSAGSQFFIVTGEASNLDNQYSVFGFVTEGMDTVYKIAVGDAMTKVTIDEVPAGDSLVTPDDIRKGNIPKNN